MHFYKHSTLVRTQETEHCSEVLAGPLPALSLAALSLPGLQAAD